MPGPSLQPPTPKPLKSPPPAPSSAPTPWGGLCGEGGAALTDLRARVPAGERRGCGGQCPPVRAGKGVAVGPP